MSMFGKSGVALSAFLLGGVVVGGLVLGPQFAPSADADPITIEAPRGAPLSFADLIEKVGPAVVSVNVRGEQAVGAAGSEELLERFRGVPGFEDFLERRREDERENGPETRETRSQGSGFFISADGFAVTNHHVIDGATEIQLVMSDGTELEAELIGADPDTDLAVVKVLDGGTFPYVEFEKTDKVRVGDWVVALGNPFGLGGTATAGIVSADGRDITGSNYTDFLQIDASINRGNSGGPTFDLNGRVIGVNTQILSPTGGSVGIGFAIPAELAISVTNELREKGRVSRGWLGVTIRDFTPEFAEALDIENGAGALIGDVSDGSPADKAGMRRSDVVIALNGVDIETSSELTRAVGRLRVGSRNEFVILRRGEELKLNVVIAERTAEALASLNNTVVPGAEPEDDEEEKSETGQLGLALNPLDSDTRKSLGLDDDESGLLITAIDADSPFAALGATEGLALLEVNGRMLETRADFDAAIAAARDSGKEQVLVAVRSAAGTGFATVDISEDEE